MKIGTREIGPNHPVYIIAELGVNHDGSPERAMQLVDVAHSAGADAIKLQYFETDRLMSKSAKLAAYQKAAGETDPIAMLRRLELRIEDMAPIVDRAHALGMHAIVTVFSTELVDLAERLPWDAYKTASPDIVHKPLLDRLMATGKPMIVSTGASTSQEVSRAIGWLEMARSRLAVLQCVSCYPTPPGQSAIPVITGIRELFGEPVGYSDHTDSADSGSKAAFYGARIVEKHLTYDRRATGPDHAASLDGAGFAAYVDAIRAFERACAEALPALEQLAARDKRKYRGLHGHWENQARKLKSLGAYAIDPLAQGVIDLKTVLPIEEDVRRVSRQSLVAHRDLPAGHTLAARDFTIKRPGTGFLPFEMDLAIGRRLRVAVEADTVIGREAVA
jgi:N-acetylneuraminate synthase/N,N'-diacetyllegionaminate synthase